MWIPSKIVEWLGLNVENISRVQQELAGVRAERDLLKLELAKSQINSDWFRMKVNQLEVERVALMEKAYNIKIPAPEILRTPNLTIDPMKDDFTFEDMGNELAKKFGLPSYDPKN